MVRRLALVALVVAGCSADGGDADGPYSALLITLDTTRADALSCYGAPAGRTPHLDALAAEGVRYTNARTVAPLTLPSHASMLTGLVPPRHGVRDNGLVALPRSARTVAERASEAGLQTAAFVAAVVLDDTFGLDQGFDVYGSAPRRGPVAHSAERPAGEVVDDALAWLEARDPERRFFLWVHLFDPHAPYAPPGPFLRRAGGDPYAGEVAYTDHQIGRLFDALRADGGYDETVIVVAADHGESLGDHGEPTHGVYVWDTTMRVPFLVRDPGGARAGEVSDEVVSVVDVNPTLAAALGLAPDDSHDGTNLFRSRSPADRAVYFESYYAYVNYSWSPLAGVADARGKYVHGRTPRLFDPSSDPTETRDVLALRERDAREYRLALAEFADAPVLPRGGETVEGSVLADLSSLGYLGGSGEAGGLPHPLAPNELPDPVAALDAQLAIRAGRYALENGRFEEARAQLAPLVAEQPRNWVALSLLARTFIDQGRLEEALPHLEALLAEGPQWPASWHNLGLCRKEVKRWDDAIAAFRRALEGDPKLLASKAELAQLLEFRGQREEARRLTEELRSERVR